MQNIKTYFPHKEEQHPEGRRPLPRNLKVICLCLLLILGHVSLEAGALMERFFAGYGERKINPFLDSSYVFPVNAGEESGIRLKWWVYYVTNDFLWVIAFFVLCKLALSYSYRLFRVCAMYLIYHLIDHFMLWYNYRSSEWVYYVLNGMIIISIMVMIIPEKKQAVVKSFH